MARRGDPERIREAQRAGTIARLRDRGLTEAQAAELVGQLGDRGRDARDRPRRPALRLRGRGLVPRELGS